VWTERLGGQQFRQFDTVIISGGAGVAAAAKDESFISLLAIVCSQSSSICPIGNGHVLLSATGLARQDWASAVRDSLRESPAALSRHGRDEALMISLSLVKRDLGSTVARTVVEHLDLDHDRPLPIELESVATLTPAEKAQGSARWLERNCERAIAVSDAARTAAMSERNFLRLFKREIGLTPSEYLLRVRLDLVCQRLLQTDLPIDKIARRTGLSNGERLSKLFRRRFSASPTEYRLNGLNRIQHRDDLAVDGPEEKRTACPSSSEAAL
jgi:AraC-like DNA-binding protein